MTSLIYQFKPSSRSDFYEENCHNSPGISAINSAWTGQPCDTSDNSTDSRIWTGRDQGFPRQSHTSDQCSDARRDCGDCGSQARDQATISAISAPSTQLH